MAIATREIDDKLASGEVPSIKIGGADTANDVLIRSEIEAEITAANYTDDDVRTLLNTGEEDVDLNHLTVQGTIDFPDADDPQYVGLVLAIGQAGRVILRDIPESDVTWTGTDNSVMPLTANVESAAVVGVTVDEAVPLGSGTFEFLCDMTNTSNQDRSVTFRSYVDATPAGTQTILLSANTTNKMLGFYGPLSVELTGTETITITAEASGADTLINGDVYASTVKITKAVAPAAAAAVAELQAETHRIFTSAVTLGNDPSIVDIEAALGGAVIEDMGHFFLTDGSNAFSVIYAGGIYNYIKLKQAS